MSEALPRKQNGLHRKASQQNFETSIRQSLEMATEMVAREVPLTISSSVRFGFQSSQNAYEVC